MMARFRRQRLAPLISLLLLAVVARALVPAGFMPSGDGSAQLTLCPDGMLMPADASHPDGGHPHVDHCPFGAAPFAAPIASLPVLPAFAAAISLPASSCAPWMMITRSSRSHQARAPPADISPA